MAHPVLVLVGVLCAAALSVSPAHGKCLDGLGLYTPPALVAERVSYVQSAPNSAENADLAAQCLKQLLERGFFEQALQLYETYFMTHNLQLSGDQHLDAMRVKNAFETFTASFKASQQKEQIIAPAVQWAQSKDKIFLLVKLAMRVDSPGCLHCTTEKIEITENSVKFSSYGIYSQIPARFVLDLDLFKAINASESTYEVQSLGHVFFTLAKQEKNDLWLYLTQNTTQRFAIWWDMRDKHTADMEEWGEKLEEHVKAEEKKRKAQRKAEKEAKKKSKQAAQKQAAEGAQAQQEEDKGWFGWIKDMV